MLSETVVFLENTADDFWDIRPRYKARSPCTARWKVVTSGAGLSSMVQPNTVLAALASGNNEKSTFCLERFDNDVVLKKW